MGTANLAIGLLGMYAEIHSPARLDYQVIGSMTINILFACFAFFDTFIKTIPGFPNKNT
jgi:hypothetical protein